MAENDFEWMKNIPNYVTFDTLVFEKHPIAKSLEKLGDLLAFDVIDNYRKAVQAKHIFNDDSWISVIGGIYHTDMDQGIYEVWSNLLPEPVNMNIKEINEHLKKLQGIE